jgi:crotonobetainyl-CoA:carnitine CoA-transferase CaiB-like acyl-CoA transferase
MLGEHSDEVLTEFGFTQAQIAELKAEAVIRGRET